MAVTVKHHPQSGHFIATLDDQPAGYIEYKLRDGDIALLHTIVDEAYEGQGVGSALARDALDTARAKGWGVLPYCPFIQAYIVKHPDYLDLVPAARRTAFGLAAA